MPAPKKMPSRSSSMIVTRPKSCASSTTFESAILKAYASGKIMFGPRGSQADESVHTSSMSTLHLLGDLLGSDAVVFDDRALNKEPFVTDRAGRRARIVTSLDIIEELHARGLLSAAERRKCRHRLRIVRVPASFRSMPARSNSRRSATASTCRRSFARYATASTFRAWPKSRCSPPKSPGS